MEQGRVKVNWSCLIFYLAGMSVKVNWSCLIFFYRCRNVCATEYAEVCEERVATRLGEILTFFFLFLRAFDISALPINHPCNWNGLGELFNVIVLSAHTGIISIPKAHGGRIRGEPFFVMVYKSKRQ